MKKGELITLKITDLVFPDKAKGTVTENGEEKKVKVKYALPGQTCSVRITKKRGGLLEGQVVEVITPAENEIDPLCPWFGQCGGCSFLNLPYEEQLRLKEDHVKHLLMDAGIDLSSFDSIVPSPEQDGYRNKMEYSFGDDTPGGPLKLGLHERGSFYNIISTAGCRLVDEDFETIRHGVESFFASSGETYFHKRTHEGFLRHLVIRKGKVTGEILINLVTTSSHELDVDPFVEMLRGLPLKGKLTGVLHTVNDGVADVVQAESQTCLLGESVIHDRILDLDFEISPFSFFQTNTLGAEKLYSVVRSFVQSALISSEKPIIYDLYCGTGTIAQVMAPIARKVVGVEIVEEAVEAAKANAQHNGLTNCTFMAGDVLTVVDTLPEKPEVIILDPPREGIHPKAIFKIIDFAPQVFVYVSCKPSSLARDLPFFTNAGYEIKGIRCVDMFPNTQHVESVVLLSHISGVTSK